jgi:hypothetical protein
MLYCGDLYAFINRAKVNNNNRAKVVVQEIIWLFSASFVKDGLQSLF